MVSKAIRYYQNAARMGDARGYYKLGDIYSSACLTPSLEGANL
ncbi:hypothetical protein [Helicobacter bizzozeronii]|nr:hypothetical protein [Helicobacter bizzozeronii]GMT38203.1 hypothetical protein NHP20013_02680 [Helicobacter bizzozeronii]CCF79725.1 hypothetical protein HBZS_101730 [Helicobacter bizzozeronii CCUG 35545]